MVKKAPLEREEQITFCNYLDFMNILYFAVPNGGSRNEREAKNLKKEGVKAGVPDMVVILEGQCLFVEMKRVKGSTTSKEQKVWIETLTALGHHAKVCKGAKEAIEFVEAYLPERKRKINVKQGSLI